MELVITRAPCNGFGSISYDMINQGLGIPILLTGIRVLLKVFLVLCVWVRVECVKEERERGMFWFQGDSVMGG